MRETEKENIAPFYFAGIYKIQSKYKPERIYVGSAYSLANRKESHLSALKSNNHRNGKLQNHYNKYGKDDLDFSILKLCDFDKGELIDAEQYFIDELNPFFNIAKNAERPNVGRKMSEESKRKLSEAKKGKFSPAQKAALERLNARNLNPFKGKKHTEESKRKISESLKGKKASVETKAKLSEQRKGKGNSFYGKKHKESTRQKMSDVWHDTHKNLPQWEYGKKAVLQYSKDGKFIMEFESGVNASVVTGINKAAIYSCLCGKSKTSGGYKWKYLSSGVKKSDL